MYSGVLLLFLDEAKLKTGSLFEANEGDLEEGIRFKENHNTHL